MADYFCQFSCMFDVGTAENAARAIEIQRQQAVALFDEEGSDLGFDVQHDPESGAGALWISSDEYGEPEHVIAFVLACAGAFDLRGRWGFGWALTCSRPRLDGFGGGAQVIDLGARRSVAWTDCEHWLQSALDPVSDAEPGIAQSAVAGGEQVVGTGPHPHEN